MHPDLCLLLTHEVKGQATRLSGFNPTLYIEYI